MASRPEQLVERNIIACWVMFAVHALATAFLLVGLVNQLSGRSTTPTFGTGSFEEGRQLGYQLSLPVLLVFNGVGGLWASANARALRSRKGWARTSALAYWAFAGLFCGCLPLSVYGLWSLTREGVAELLGRSPTGR